MKLEFAQFLSISSHRNLMHPSKPWYVERNTQNEACLRYWGGTAFGDTSVSLGQHPHLRCSSPFDSASEHVYSCFQLCVWSAAQVWNIPALAIRDLWKQRILNIYQDHLFLTFIFLLTYLQASKGLQRAMLCGWLQNSMLTLEQAEMASFLAPTTDQITLVKSFKVSKLHIVCKTRVVIPIPTS